MVGRIIENSVYEVQKLSRKKRLEWRQLCIDEAHDQLILDRIDAPEPQSAVPVESFPDTPKGKALAASFANPSGAQPQPSRARSQSPLRRRTASSVLSSSFRRQAKAFALSELKSVHRIDTEQDHPGPNDDCALRLVFGSRTLELTMKSEEDAERLSEQLLWRLSPANSPLPRQSTDAEKPPSPNPLFSPPPTSRASRSPPGSPRAAGLPAATDPVTATTRSSSAPPRPLSLAQRSGLTAGDAAVAQANAGGIPPPGCPLPPPAPLPPHLHLVCTRLLKSPAPGRAAAPAGGRGITMSAFTPVVISGPRGVGKTALAAAVACDRRIQTYFSRCDGLGVIWVRVGPNAVAPAAARDSAASAGALRGGKLLTILEVVAGEVQAAVHKQRGGRAAVRSTGIAGRNLAATAIASCHEDLDFPPHGFSAPHEVTSYLANVICGRQLPCLLVLDDVHEPEVVDLCRDIGATLLVTTPSLAVAKHVAGLHAGIDTEDGFVLLPLSQAEGMALLESAAGVVPGRSQLPVMAERVVEECRGSPLALYTMGRLIRSQAASLSIGGHRHSITSLNDPVASAAATSDRDARSRAWEALLRRLTAFVQELEAGRDYMRYSRGVGSPLSENISDASDVEHREVFDDATELASRAALLTSIDALEPPARALLYRLAAAPPGVALTRQFLRALFGGPADTEDPASGSGGSSMSHTTAIMLVERGILKALAPDTSAGTGNGAVARVACAIPYLAHTVLVQLVLRSGRREGFHRSLEIAAAQALAMTLADSSRLAAYCRADVATRAELAVVCAWEAVTSLTTRASAGSNSTRDTRPNSGNFAWGSPPCSPGGSPRHFRQLEAAATVQPIDPAAAYAEHMDASGGEATLEGVVLAARVMSCLGKLDASAALWKRAYKMICAKHGDAGLSADAVLALSGALCRLGMALCGARKLGDAEAATMDALDILGSMTTRKSESSGRWALASALSLMASLLEARGQLERAELCWSRAWAVARPTAPEELELLDEDDFLWVGSNPKVNRLSVASGGGGGANRNSNGSHGSQNENGGSGSITGTQWHPMAVKICAGLATLLLRRGDIEESLVLHEMVLAADEQRLGAAHPFCAFDRVNCGDAAGELGHARDAQEHYRRAADAMAAASGGGGTARTHPQLPRVLSNRGLQLCRAGMAEAAEGVLRRALELKERLYGTSHPAVAVALNNLGCCLWTVGQLEAAEALLRRALGIRRTAMRAEAAAVSSLENPEGRGADADQASEGLGLDLRNLLGGRRAAAAAAAAASTLVGAARGAEVAQSLGNLAALLRAAGRLEEAEQMLSEGVELTGSALGADSPAVADWLLSLAALHMQKGKVVQAQRAVDRAVSIRKRAYGPRHSATAAAVALQQACKARAVRQM